MTPAGNNLNPYSFKINGIVRTFYAVNRKEAKAMALRWMRRHYGT